MSGSQSLSPATTDPFLKPIFLFFGLLGIRLFWTFESILLGVSCYKRVKTLIFICTHRAASFYYCTYYLIEGNVLGYYCII